MYDNCHISGQVTSDTLPVCRKSRIFGPMKKRRFKEALLWHLENEKPNLADLVRGSGVSRDAMNKVKAREDGSTDVENATAVAHFYGKTVEQFLNCERVDSSDKMSSLVALLDPDERRMVEAQIEGLLSAREL
jgi:hypothetical protein